MGVPMLERVVAALQRHGVTEVILSVGYLPDRFIDAYPDFRVCDLPISYAVETVPLDTGGAIGFAARHGQVDSTFVVVNGDNLTDLDLTALLQFHRDTGAQATIALHPVEDPSRYGVVVKDEVGRVLSFVEKPPAADSPSRDISAGTYVMEPTVLDLIPEGARVSVERVTFPELVGLGTLYAKVDTSYWLDAGTPATYLQAHADILSGSRTVTPSLEWTGTSWVHPLADVDPTAELRGASIDEGCKVGAGAVVRHSVLMPGAVVGPRAEVASSILGPHSSVGEGARLGPTCVVGAHEAVADFDQLEGDVRVGVAR
jgi:mannose-1-phosphate guanylyltransferase